MAILRRTWFLIFIGVLIAVIGASAAVLLATRAQSSQSNNGSDGSVPLAARVDKIDGTVGINKQSDSQPDNQGNQPGSQPSVSDTQAIPNNGQAGTSSDWIAPTKNAAVSVGDRIYVRDRSHLGIAFSGRNYARLNPNTEMDVLSLDGRRTQLALRQGSAVFDVGALAPGELCEVATPYGAVDFVQPGLYQVGIDDSDAVVSVLSGLAQVVGSAGTGQCVKGQLLTLADAAADQAAVSQIAPDVCGSIVDDYYGYRYPDSYDGRYSNYNTYLDDPYYYDPYRRSASYQYVPDEEDIAGLNDLDSYGSWQDVPGYGQCWQPRVAAGWAPYQDGYWSNEVALGLTWVSNEPWGWAPYHYGRWASVNQGWYWVPAEAIARPVYAPALCAFVPLPQYNQVGWCPLGPGDPYVPRYYDAAFRPQYIGSTTVINRFVNNTRIVNYNVPGAVTVVSASAFGGAINPRMVTRADQRLLSQARPVVDPFAVQGLRQSAFEARGMRPQVQIPAAETQQAFNRRVVASDAPVVPKALANSRLAQSLQVQPVPKAALKQKLQMNNTGQVVSARQQNGLPIPVGRFQGSGSVQAGANQAAINQQRQAQMQALSQRAAQGDRAAGRQMRQLEQQQQVDDKMARRAANQQAAQQQQATQQAQMQQQRQGQRQAAQQQAAQQAQMQQQRQDQRQAQQQQAAQQAQIQQQRQVQRQAPPPQQQAPQSGGQSKADRKAARRQGQ